MQSGRNIIEQAGRVASGRRVRSGANATVMTLALIGILVLVNILAERNHARLDLTATGEFSLSPETGQILQNLQQPVEIIGFFGQQDQFAQEELESKLKEYTAQTDLIRYRFVDPDVEPVMVNTYDITSYGTIVVQSGERTQKIQQTTEQAVTGAILTVTRDTQPTVYFLTGHGERSLDGMDQTSYSEARRVLEEDNLTVQPISLVVSPTIPLENSVLVVADPQQPLQPREEQVIAEYVTRGGSLLLLSNPLVQAPLPTVMSAVGLTWNNDLVFDQQAELNNPFAPVVMDYPFSSITSDLAGEPTLFATVRTISQNQMAPAAGLTVTPLLRSSPDSQAASNFSGDQVQLDPNDPQGPLTFGFSVEGAITATQLLTGTVPADPTGRVVAIGDADFASNVYLTLPGIANRELFRSTVAWLATQDDEFTLPPREDPVDRSIFLTASTSNLVFYGSTFGLPLLVILAGVVVWWRRR